jgi:hypothetical protein
MRTKKSTTEELFLKIFKVVILIVMTLALVATAGGLMFAAYQYTQSPKAVAPAQPAPAKSVTLDTFLKQLPAQSPSSETPVVESPLAPPAPAAPEKYNIEAGKIMGCLQESTKLAGLPAADNAATASEALRQQLQSVADAPTKTRGQPYVTDAAKLVCEIMMHAKVIDYRKAQHEADVLTAALSFHMQAWDDVKQTAQAFEAKEQARVNQAEDNEYQRVTGSKEAAKFTLLMAAGAFALFMLLALSLMVAAIESNLRRMSMSLKEFH